MGATSGSILAQQAEDQLREMVEAGEVRKGVEAYEAAQRILTERYEAAGLVAPTGLALKTTAQRVAARATRKDDQ